MRRKIVVATLLGIFWIGLWAGVVFFAREPAWLQQLKLKSIDARFVLRGPAKPSGEVVNVLIDAESIKSIGRWPWQRSVFARMIMQLQDYGAKVIVFDLLFAEPQQKSVQNAVSKLMDTYMTMGLLGDDVMSRAFMDEMAGIARKADNDKAFAQAINWSENVVLSMAFEQGKAAEDFQPGMSKAAYEEFEQAGKLAEQDILFVPKPLMPLRKFVKGARGLGYVNIYPDKDGCIRKGKLVLNHLGAVFKPLALAAAAAGRDIKPVLDGRGRVGFGDKWIDMTKEGDVYLNFYGQNKTITNYSYVDVLEAKVPKDALQDKIVLIGGAATGLGDLWASPLAENISGVELQSTFTDNILQDNLLEQPEGIKTVTMGCIAAISGVTIFLMLLLPLLWAPFACLAGFAGYFVFCQYLFSVRQIIWPLALPLAAGCGIWAISLGVNYILEGRQKRWIKNAFAHYLSPEVIDLLVKDHKMLELRGRQQEVTIFFSDIRGFTTISENFDPTELTALLNNYLTRMTDIIFEYGGTLDKYIGDAIMAFYGAPLSRKEHALSACRAAVAMTETLNDMQAVCKQKNWPVLQTGMGINTGEVVVGNMGSSKRFDYSVLGNEVNIASRLEGLTKTYGVQIIISEQTRDKIKEKIVCRQLDKVRMKGIYKPIYIYELLYDTDAERPEFVLHFEQGLNNYRQGRFDRARKDFYQVLELKPGDKPAELFIERCDYLNHNPPGTCWDGVWDFYSKK